MKKIILLLLILVGAVQVIVAQNRSRSIGIRLGEPTGITYKKYLNRSRAIEFGLGSASTAWNHNYYERSFRNRDAYNGYLYDSHSVNGIVYFQGRYLLNYPIPVEGVEGRFDWYWGVGAMLKVAQVDYYYRNEVPPYPSYTDRRTDIDLGPEGIGGVEYKFEDLPFTLFAEVSLMLEIGDRFGAVRGFVGTGGRYNF